MKAWRAFLFVLLLVWSATGLLARPTHSFSSSCHLEGLGSVRFLTDATGVITDTFTYDAFGILVDRRARTSGGVLTAFANPALETPPAGTTPTVNNYRYTGEQWDQDLGMYYLRARYYKPDLGRFWTMDSYEGDSEEPSTLNLYLYCADNPINLVHPSGNDFELGGLLGVMNIGGTVFAQVSPIANRVQQRARSLSGRDVDAYIWRWGALGTDLLWPGSRVGHVMVTEAGTKNVYLSQFPHAFGGASSPKGPNTKLNRAETVTTEGSTPDDVFRAHLPNAAAFDAAVKDHVSRKSWIAKPKTKDQTHCARAGYDVLKAGQVLPGSLGGVIGSDALEELQAAWAKSIWRYPPKKQ